jgi:uncharacterized protein (TIGR04255 family)
LSVSKTGGAELADREFPRLTHPALREALVDIRLHGELPASAMEKFEAPKGFPVKKGMKLGQFELHLEVDKPSEAKITEGLMGFRYEREDGSDVLQLRRNGLTYSSLKDYPGWEVLKEEAREAWRGFFAVTGPVNVSRLAVRYVNAINIPQGADYDEYLTTGPRVPKLVPSIVASFVQRIVVPIEQDSANAIITQTLEQSGAAPAAPAVLDIDVFTNLSIEGTSPNIWSGLEKLRNIANRIFFSSVTQKVIESLI